MLYTPEGKPTPGFTNHILPLIRYVAEQRPIPSRKQVLGNLRVAVAIDEPVKPVPERRNPIYGNYQALYKATYGFDEKPWKRHLDKKRQHNGSDLWEYTPNTGRYGMFPLLPLRRPTISGANILTAPLSKLQDVKAAKALFDRLYPATASQAFTSKWGDHFIAINSHENRDVGQSYKLLFPKQFIRSLSGNVGVHSCLIGNCRNGAMRLLLNFTQGDRLMGLLFTCAGKARPRVDVVPRAALVDQIWNTGTGELEIKIKHSDGAVSVRVTKATL